MRHVAHFNWATLRAPIGSAEVAPFVNAIPKVNALAERSPGFVWREPNDRAKGLISGWPLFTDNDRLIASFSVWESPEQLREYVYKTVHGAFYKRSNEWFLPGTGVNYALWWVPMGHIPDMVEARQNVERFLAEGLSDSVFNFDFLSAA